MEPGPVLTALHMCFPMTPQQPTRCPAVIGAILEEETEVQGDSQVTKLESVLKLRSIYS